MPRPSDHFKLHQEVNLCPLLLSYPGVYIEEVSSGVRTISGVATSIALFIGWAGRGPTDRAVRITNFGDYQRGFGALDKRSLLGYGVKQFFDNGGSDAYVLRLADGAALASKVVIGALTVEANSPGLWGDAYTVTITRRPAPDAARFQLRVLDRKNNNALVESFENLSMDSADPNGRFAQSVINDRSAFIKVTVATNTPPAAGTTDLTGGTEGAVLTPGTGVAHSPFHTALLAQFGVGSVTDRLDLFNIVCVPGETDPPTLATLQGHCKRRHAFLIADSDSNATVTSLNTGFPSALITSDSPNAAYFFPCGKGTRPATGKCAGGFSSIRLCGRCTRPHRQYARRMEGAGRQRSVAQRRHWPGHYDERCRERPVESSGHQLPALVTSLRHCSLGFAHDAWAERPRFGVEIIPVRRMALFLEESLYRGTQWVN